MLKTLIGIYTIKTERDNQHTLLTAQAKELDEEIKRMCIEYYPNYELIREKLVRLGILRAEIASLEHPGTDE